MKNVEFLDRPYTPSSIQQEMVLLKDAAVKEASRTAAVAAIAFVYTTDTQYLFPLKQFGKDQKLAKRVVADFVNEKNALFWIVVGISEETNKFATQFKDYTLNIVGHMKEKVIYQKHTLLLSGGFFTVIESKEDYSALDSEDSEEGIKKVLETETNDNEFDVEGVEVAQNPFA